MGTARSASHAASTIKSMAYGGRFNNFTGMPLARSALAMLHLLKTIKRFVRAHNGFTLLEMMIVTAILGLTSAIAIPNYVEWHAKYQLRQAVTEIQTQLSIARISAMSRNSVVNVSLVLNGGKVQISAGDASGVSVIPATQMMSAVTGLNPAPTTVAFSPLGTRSGGGPTNQQIMISNNRGLSYTVRVTPRGKVTWCPAAICP